jgi:DMSO/TMAO reductase YedYZ molybdopterin-dependent catalytic subunit
LAQISTLSFFGGGLAAGTVAIAISLLLRLYMGGLFVPELASQTLFSLTPGEVESQAVQTLGPLAKYSSFIGAVIVNIIVYGLIAILLGSSRLYNKLPWKGYLGKAILSSIIAYVILLALSTLLLSLTEATTTGAVSISDLAIYLIAPNIGFGFILPFFYERRILSLRRHRQRPPSPQPPPPTPTSESKKEEPSTDISSSKSEVDYKKRLLLRAGIASAVALPILFYGTNRLLFPPSAPPIPSTQSPSILQSGPKPAGFENPILTPLLQSEITPTDLFYRIDINPITPMVNADTWKLTVKGLVNNPFEINYEELKAMPSIEQYATLECISNKIGGDLISNAIWRGVRLKDLLERAEIKPGSGAKYIVFRCFDGYDVGIPLEKGLEDGTILAYEMNKATLTPAHGYPVRAIVPNIYGMMNAKWITEIEVVDSVYEGFWQRKGWSNIAKYNTHSYTVVPGNAAVSKRFRGFQSSTSVSSTNTAPNGGGAGSGVTIGGIAFAGDRVISKVEVSTDNGSTWKPARIKEPLSQYTWVLWAAELNQLGSNKEYRVMVRATDSTGVVQTNKITDPFPNGATGYHIVNV